MVRRQKKKRSIVDAESNKREKSRLRYTARDYILVRKKSLDIVLTKFVKKYIDDDGSWTGGGNSIVLVSLRRHHE
jgi:hypothetical protein